MVRCYSPRGRRDEREGSHRITERRRIAGSHLDKPLAEKALHARTKIKLTPALSPRVILRMSDWAFLLERCRDDLSEIPFPPSSRLSAAAETVLHRGINLGADAQMAIDIGRREFPAGLWGTAVTWPVVAQAQQLRGTTPRIGVLWHASNEQEEAIYLGAFRQGLRDVGYVEGQTIILENRFAGEQYDRLDALATIQQKVA
jgi:hypothetical protein